MKPLSIPQQTAELWRVCALPRRRWTDEQADACAEHMTRLFRTPGGSQTLRRVQAIALFELGYRRGLFNPVRVSGGKTLISLLAPRVVNAKRPLLVVPARLVDKTKRDRLAYSYHWQLPTNVRIESYELLGRVQGAEILTRYRPDIIILDESQKARNRKAACTRRLLRYLHENPSTVLVFMSGTSTTKRISDYAHLLSAALKEHAPIPLTYDDLEAWGCALDQRETNAERGALEQLCNEEEAASDIDGTRRAFRRRLTETQGVVATQEDGVGVPLLAEVRRIDPPINVQCALEFVRRERRSVDGDEPFPDGLSLWRHVRQLVLGFYYRWDPSPPKPWLEARKLWAKTCQYILTHGQRETDSELQVAQAIDRGHYDWAVPVLSDWRAIRDTFKPNTTPVWISDYLIRWISEEVKRDPVLVWVEHTAFGRELERVTGIPYFAEMGRARNGKSIMDHRDAPAICSVRTIGEGFNLQHFNRNLIVGPFTNGQQAEQTLGRTHRDGQEEDVIATFLVLAQEHDRALEVSRADARYIEATQGQPQKLNIADWI